MEFLDRSKVQFRQKCCPKEIKYHWDATQIQVNLHVMFLMYKWDEREL